MFTSQKINFPNFPSAPKRRTWLILLIIAVATTFIVGLVLFFVRLYPTGFSHAATITWTGTAGDGLWETAGNWSGSAVPTASDDVTINGSAETTVTLSSGQTANFSSLTIGGGGVFTNTLILQGNIGTGGNITLDAAGWLYQKNIVTQILSGTLTVKNSGTLTHTANTNDKSYIVNFKAATIDIQSGGTVTASGKGYSAESTGPGPGLSASSEGVWSASGGAHGGDGGTYNSATGGTAYCTVTNISTMGSSAGLAGQPSDTSGHGAGGGLIVLYSTATTTINGSILASGSAGAGLTSISGAYSGGGGGGGIRLTAGGAITGTPTAISANGGNGFGESSAAGGGGCIQVGYHTANTVAALSGTVTVTAGTSFVGSGQTDGLFYAAQSNATPTTTFTSVSQSSLSGVTFEASVADSDLDITSLIVEYSLNGGVTWASSTLSSVTPSQGTVTTSTGRISGIATDTSTTTLTAVWNIAVDAPTTNTTTAYLRFVPSDGRVNGSVVTSTVFTFVTTPPTGLSLSGLSDHLATLSWTAGNAFSNYYVADAGASVTSDWIDAATYRFTNLTCATSYTFKVKGKSALGIETAFSDGVATTTVACGVAFSASGGGGGGGGSDAAPATPSAAAPNSDSAPAAELPRTTEPAIAEPDFLKPVAPELVPIELALVVPTEQLKQPETFLPVPTTLETDTPTVPLLPEQVEKVLVQQQQVEQVIDGAAQTFTPTLRAETPVTIGAESHTVTVAEATPDRVTFTLRSKPVTLTLAKGERKEIDTSGDGILDVRVEYKGLLGDKPLLALAPLTDHSETTDPFTINAGALQTNSTDVLLSFTVPAVKALEISNTPNFDSSTFFVAASSTRWRLPSKAGVATVYVRIYKKDGAVFAVSDTIFVRPATSNQSVPTKNTTTSRPVFTFNLKTGSIGKEVRLLQTLLKAQNVFPVTQAVTGFFGPVTRQAILDLQKKYNLPRVGEVGPRTRAILNGL